MLPQSFPSFPLNLHSASFTNIPESQHHSFTGSDSPDSSLCFDIQSPPFRATRADPGPLGPAWTGC